MFDREPLLAALRRARDPRGLKIHEIAAEMKLDDKTTHRLRKILADAIEEDLIEKAEGARYRVIGWTPEVTGAATKPAYSLRAAAKAIATTPPSTAAATSTAGAATVDGKAAGLANSSGGAAAATSGARPSAPVPVGAIAGGIRVHPAGYGFVQREDGEEDVFIAARNRGSAMDGDRVAITTWLGYKGTEGRVTDVLLRGRAKLTGQLRQEGRAYFLETDDPRILSKVSIDGGPGAARIGQAVVAEIVQYPAAPEAPMVARVLRVLGDPDDPRTEVAKVIACAEIPDEFPDDVVAAAERTSQTVGLEDIVDRVDLRDRAFLTIDPETARDFDDAVCVENGPRPGLERLWVAVADVSHYVRLGSALDREARIRGVSVYLPDRAIPMLPHALSAGICSLNPEVDRCAMVARIDIDEGGNVVEAQLQAAVIKSRARLDYAGVAAALGGDLRGPRARYQDHLPQLRRMQTLAGKLRALRMARGSLDFDLPEAQVVLDEDDPRRVRDVKKSRSNPEVKQAYRLVEDFMLAANEAVARYFRDRQLDTLWRVHDVPSEQRLTAFAAFAESFGVAFSADDARSPRKMRDFLARIAGMPMERALSFLLLRSLKQAVYDVVNVGHFGLAAPEYLHFTSPIRRYPDLIVHRLLKNQLRAEGLPAGGVAYQTPPPREELSRMAAECSGHERRAMEAEREVVDMYRTFLMRDRVGDEYDGTIVGVTSFGIFVEISEPFVEGLVKVEKLGSDFFELDERTMRLTAAKSGHSFALGDLVRVRIENVSVPRRKIDLGLVSHAESVPRVPSSARRSDERKGKKGPGEKPARHRRGEGGGGKGKPAGADGDGKRGRKRRR